MSATHLSARAATNGLMVLAWYALPDVVRSRRARALARTGLMAGAIGINALLPAPAVGPAPTALPKVDLPAQVVAALGIGGAAGVLAGGIWAEKAIFARGERRRAEGARCGHTPLAVVFGALTAVAEVTLWPRIESRLSGLGV